jgi:hypothetical protein
MEIASVTLHTSSLERMQIQRKSIPPGLQVRLIHLLGSSTLDHVVDAIFGNDDLPETLQNRLINDGFIQIEGDGLFAEDRYVLREQIASVSGDEVHLNVTRDELIER